MNALYRRQKINPTGKRPPSIARRLHEAKTLQTFFLSEWRRITAQPIFGNLKIQQCQPILEPWPCNEISAPGKTIFYGTEKSTQAPQATGIEAANNNVSFWHEYALHLTQNLMR